MLFLWFVLTSTSLVSALPFTNTTLPCINTTLFKPNSTFDTNRRLILTSLPSLVPSHYGFYNGSVGQIPNKVYALGMCLPGTEEAICSGCLSLASKFLLETCLQEKNGHEWLVNGTACMVRYSDTSFVGSLELEPHDDQYLSGNGYRANEAEYIRVWSGLTQLMIQEASSSTDATWSSGKYYADDAGALPDSQAIYAAMQCTPDLSQAQCNLCLNECLDNFRRCCLGRQGGFVAMLSCGFRAELYPFTGAFTGVTARPLSPPPTKTESNKLSTVTIVAFVVPIVVVIIIMIITIIILLVMLARRSQRRKSYKETDLDQSGMTTVHSLQFDFKTIEAATDKFSQNNKLGQGGFGEGTLVGGTEVAVKRLSKTSEQGTQEFKNEVVLVAKLQHRSLVKLLGFCLERDEKVLVYEFVSNKSLDYFLFDPTEQRQLDWTKRYNIILGITRGILLLHHDSRLTIIHRDLKASNILLDTDMNPKIADFGMARIFGIDQSVANTKRIAGTFGYMPPEYVIHGQFSMKTDVYSFGVLVLEIICGKKNRSFSQENNTDENLVTYVWRLWRNKSPLELVDPSIQENYQSEEVTRCIHIALLCVQKDPKDRPNMSTIMLMLTSNFFTLPIPQPPGFLLPHNHGFESSESPIRSTSKTLNDVSTVEPR